MDESCQAHDRPQRDVSHEECLGRHVSSWGESPRLIFSLATSTSSTTMPPPLQSIGLRPLLRPQTLLRTTPRSLPAGRIGALAAPTSFATRSLHLGNRIPRGPHHRNRTTITTTTELHHLLSLQLQTRSFHPSPRRQDVFFLAVPAIKSTLLNITRISLLFLPFVFRYK